MFTCKVTPEAEKDFQGKLDLLDLGPIKDKILFSNGYDIQLINEMEVWYKRFLFLNFKYAGSIVPNELVDEFWHFHILDTRKYAADCEMLFNELLHHFPYFGMRGEDDRKNLNQCYEETKKLFLKEFGSIPFMNEDIQEILKASPLELMEKAASCSDCSGAAGTGT